MILRYNPTCELAIRHNGLSYTPPQILAKMEGDLAPLMAFLSTSDDKIVGNRPDPLLCDMLRRAGHCDTFITPAEATELVKQGEAIHPWGESRALFASVGMTAQAREWNHRETFSRKTSVLVEQAAHGALGLPSDANPQIVQDVAALDRMGGDVVIKSLWSSAGRGVRFFCLDTELRVAKDFADKCIKTDGAVVVERKLARMAELSFLFRRTSGGIEYCGANAYRSASGGAFGLEIFGPNSFAEVARVDGDWEAKHSALLASSLSKVLISSPYTGPIGVDAMVYRGGDGAPRLRCCMEVNMRHCMGDVANQVKRLIAPEASGFWRIEVFKNDGEWDAFCERQAREQPLCLNQNGLIVKGFFRLSGLGSDVRFGACGWVSSPLP